jgi:hypothetical protein
MLTTGSLFDILMIKIFVPYYKHITIVNYGSRVIILTTLDSRMTLQVVTSITIVILTTLEVSVMLQENIYIVQAGNTKGGRITVPLTSLD